MRVNYGMIKVARSSFESGTFRIGSSNVTHTTLFSIMNYNYMITDIIKQIV
jgi:hypothetical protein